jgi:choline kinase
MSVKRFTTVAEFRNYLTDKYGNETGEKIFKSNDYYNGNVYHTFWVEGSNGIAFEEAKADICVNKIWK